MFDLYLNETSDMVRGFYEKRINEMNDVERQELLKLIERMKNAGCTNTLPWALDEIAEGTPQFGRFLFLKHLYQIANDVETATALASDACQEYDALEKEVLSVIDKSLLEKYLHAYNRGVICQFAFLIDEGNENVHRDNVSWALMKIDSEGNHNNRTIDGLHEDVFGFDDPSVGIC